MSAVVGAALRALRSKACFFVRDDLAVARISGDDRVDFMHRIISADVRKLATGAGLPAALLTAKGRVIADMLLLRGEATLTMIVDASVKARVGELLERYIIVDDVELAFDERVVVSAHGPRLAESALLGALAALAPYETRAAEVGGVSCLAFGDDHLATLGVALVTAGADDASRLAAALQAEGLVRGDADAYEVARVEAGVPRTGRELDEDVMILEAGQLSRVSFDKGCYIGQEPVCRVNSRGRVQRLLVGLRFDGERAPTAGEELAAEGKDNAGRVTSVVRSPGALGDQLAGEAALLGLGYVHRSYAAPGTRLTFGGEGEGVAEVVALPFVGGERTPSVLPRYKQPPTSGGDEA
ncbi:MAG: folate-binding protein YgfZ [Myxococcales bacterium]|nr:folate-binding protein YgfZ [Myxococcales bacterium]